MIISAVMPAITEITSGKKEVDDMIRPAKTARIITAPFFGTLEMYNVKTGPSTIPIIKGTIKKVTGLKLSSITTPNKITRYKAANAPAKI